MLRSTSVVITTTGASPLMALSPGQQPDPVGAVDGPTRSWNFWFESALIGAV